MRKKFWITFFLGVIFCLALAATRPWEREGFPVKAMSDEAVDSLRKVVPDSPAIASADVLGRMERAAATKRIDAAQLLIKCLAFNLDPVASNESLSQEELVPAIGVLKRHYGTSVLSFIYTEGISTDKKWMRERCALAARAISSKSELGSMRVVFSLDTTNNPDVKEFARLLDVESLKVQLFDRNDAIGDQIDKAVKKKN